MDGKTIVFGLATFFHNLFTVVWIGGLIVTVISILPSVKEALGTGPQVKKVMMAFQKRQSVWVYISMAGLILTGVMLSNRNPEFEHLFGFGNMYSVLLSIKHILVLILIGLTLYRTLVLGRAQGSLTPAKERLNIQILLVNAALVVAILFSSGLIAAIARPISG